MNKSIQSVVEEWMGMEHDIRKEMTVEEIAEWWSLKLTDLLSKQREEWSQAVIKHFSDHHHFSLEVNQDSDELLRLIQSNNL